MKHLTSFVFCMVLVLLSCKKEEVPTVTTSETSNILGTTASCGGTIIEEGSGTVLARGVCWSVETTPTIEDFKTTDGAGAGSFNSSMSNLCAATTYYVRAYATNKIGTGYGMTMSFITLGQLPSASTQVATHITATTARLVANVNPNYLPTTVTFEYGLNLNYEFSINANLNPLFGNSNNVVTADIDALKPGTTYHFRVKAANSMGVINGNDLAFTTEPLTATDGDGNIYATVLIGSQYWIKENLKTTKYNDGTNIPIVSDGSLWDILTTPAYCWYNNESSIKSTYGALYNWYAVNTGKLCPSGWHVPSKTEWETLCNYLGGDQVAGGKLKESGTGHWLTSSSGANNESGFTGLPGGYRWVNGPYPSTSPFMGLGEWGYWWSNTEDNSRTYLADLINIGVNYNYVNRGGNYKEYGFSVRCIKNY